MCPQIVDILILADIHKATDLKSQAMQFLLRNREEVFATDWRVKLKQHPTLVMDVLEATVELMDGPPSRRKIGKSNRSQIPMPLPKV